MSSTRSHRLICDVIMRLLIGPFHQRFLNKNSNLMKIRFAFIQNIYSPTRSLHHCARGTISMQSFYVCKIYIGRIRMSISTVNRIYELSVITHVTLLHKYRQQHSTGPSIYRPWVHTCSKLFCRKSVLTICSYKPSRMKSVCTEGCHVGRFREFIDTACCTYRQSNTTCVGKSYEN